MSLLWMEYDDAFERLADDAFRRACQADPAYYSSLTPRVSGIIRRDTRYNVDFLYTAYLIRDDKIMEDYAVWLYQLMASVLRGKIPEEKTVIYVIGHLATIRESVQATTPPELHPQLFHLMDVAEAAVRRAAEQPLPEIGRPSRYETEIRQYMDCLLHRNGRRAAGLIHEFSDRGISLSDIYVEILAESMRRVGELWHTARITVDTEHYCTSVTQIAMAQMYPLLFDAPRKNKVLLCACPGTELHEMGARMVADLFESDGWDSIYLGAAVPMDALLDAVETNHPDLLALSVTMPQHLMACRDAVQAVRARCPGTRIAVGGRAFEIGRAHV